MFPCIDKKFGVTCSENNSSKHFLSIDILRFLAIFLITGFHIGRYFSFDLHNILSIFSLAFRQGGQVGVAVFFVIASYCMQLSYNKEKNTCFSFWKKKAKKIILPYYTAILFWIIGVNSGVAVKNIEFWDIFTHCTFIHNLYSTTMYSVSGVFWFLGTLVDFYILFPFVSAIISKYSKISFILSFVVCFSSLYAVRLLDNSVVLSRSFFVYLPCFVVGILLYDKKLNLKYGNVFLLIISLIILFFVNPKYINKLFWNLPIYAILVSIFLSIGIINLEKFIKNIKVVKWITFISKRSFSIYLYNYIFYIARPINRSSFVFCILYIFTFCFGILMYELVEKRSFISGRFKRYFFKYFWL
ncbi:MAG: acyltransferase [Alphaproteobacteria bacterium]|nr:acyltransferase [Alphaproteobacteria bacterium]